MSSSLQTQPILPSFFDPTQRSAVVWLGMAGALINTRGTMLLIDPLIALKEANGQQVSEAGYPLRVPLPIQAVDVPRADLVMYTHGDDDHIGTLTAKTLAERTQCRFLATPPVARMLAEAGIPTARIAIAREGEVVEAGPARITITPALHDWQEQDPWKREDCCGYLVQTPDGTVWHPGDSRLIDDLLAVHGVDVMFFDIAAVESHLGPQGSAALAASCGARAMVAYHYGTFDLPPGSFANCDPADALPYVEGLSARFLQLNPGEPLWLPLE